MKLFFVQLHKACVRALNTLAATPGYCEACGQFGQATLYLLGIALAVTFVLAVSLPMSMAYLNAWLGIILPILGLVGGLTSLLVGIPLLIMAVAVITAELAQRYFR
ncbi:hypothetical protein EBZ39_04900 [bacterium]|nr:hypothetical protein [bacterium]